MSAQTKEEVAVRITDLGREVAVGLMERAIHESQDEIQAHNQMLVLYSASIHILATVAINQIFKGINTREQMHAEVMKSFELELSSLFEVKDQMEFVPVGDKPLSKIDPKDVH